jgi:hypothetical protein
MRKSHNRKVQDRKYKRSIETWVAEECKRLSALMEEDIIRVMLYGN